MSDGSAHEEAFEGQPLQPEKTYVFTARRKRVSAVEARWGATEARAGGEVELVATVQGMADGQTATFQILEVDQDGSEELVDELEGTVEEGEARVTWAYVFTDDSDDAPTQEGDEEYHAPEYVFDATVCGVTGRTPEPLLWQHWIELHVPDAPPGTPYLLISHRNPNEVWAGTIGEGGLIREEPVPPGTYQLLVDGFQATSAEIVSPE